MAIPLMTKVTSLLATLMKVYEQIDKMLQYSKNDIKLLEYLLPKAVIDNELVVPRKNKFFFDECKDHYFVTFKQKEIIDKFCVSQTRVSNRLRELCNFRALQKMNQSTYLVNWDYLMQEYIPGSKRY